jgi:hypothetical protein
MTTAAIFSAVLCVSARNQSFGAKDFSQRWDEKADLGRGVV